MKEALDLVHAIEADPSAAPGLLEKFAAGRSFPIADDETATFFYWPEDNVDAVFLIHWVFGLESRQPFARIQGTNAWYLPLELPTGSRIEYKLEVVRGDEHRLIRDPRNPHEAYDPFGSNSVCPMSGYTVPGWTAPERGAAPGRLENLAVKSKVFGDTRVARVYLPHEYRPSRKLPLLVVHDGNDYLKFAGMKVVLDNLISRHEVIPLVVVFTSGGMRNQEYGANPNHAQFIVEELLPAVEASYGVSTNPRDRGLMGASFGGVASLFTAWTHPGVFGRLFLQSGSFVFTDIGRHDRGPLWDPVVDFVNAFRKEPAKLKARVFMSCGRYESLIFFNRSLAPLARRAGLDVRFVESPDGHNWIGWRDRLRDGLTWLYPGHLWMYYE